MITIETFRWATADNQSVAAEAKTDKGDYVPVRVYLQGRAVTAVDDGESDHFLSGGEIALSETLLAEGFRFSPA